MHDFAELLRAIAWPAVVLLFAWKLRLSIERLLEILGMRIATARKFSFGLKGFQLEGEVNLSAARLDALEIQLKRLAQASANLDEDGEQPVPVIEVPEALQKLANKYRTVRISEYARRVRRRDQLANEIATMATAQSVPRELLAKSGDEGLFVGLATMMVESSTKDDVRLWLHVAPAVTLKHVAYRCSIALSQMLANGLIARADIPALRAALTRFIDFADGPLLRIVERTLFLVDLAADGTT